MRHDRARRGGWRAATAVAIAAFACGGLAASTAVAQSGSGDLVIGSYGGSWGRAIQLGFVDDFQKDSGINVTLTSTFDGAKSAAAVISGNLPPEDVLDAEFGLASTYDAEGLLAPIDYSQVDAATLEKIPEEMRKPYAVAFGYFSMGMAYRTDMFPADAPPSTWADYWDFEKFPGNRGMLIWPSEPVPEFPELAAGTPVDQLTPVDYTVVEQQLDLLKPHVPKFAETPSELIQQLADGSIAMCACPLHRVEALQSAGFSDKVAIAWGTARLQPPTYSVWKNAPNIDNAMKYIASVLSPEAQARWATVGFTAPINPDAFSMMSEQAIENAPNAPSHTGVFYRDDDWYIAKDDQGRTNFQALVDFWNDWITK